MYGTMHLPDKTDEFNHLLEARVGLNRRVIDNAPCGTADEPVIVVEINPRHPWRFSQDALRTKHLRWLGVCSIRHSTAEAGPFERFHTDSFANGLDSESLSPILSELKIGAVIVAHQSEWLTEHELSISHDIVSHIKMKLCFLLEVGLHYLTMDRATRTLSAGEAQRIDAFDSGVELPEKFFIGRKSDKLAWARKAELNSGFKSDVKYSESQLRRNDKKLNDCK